eukprot:7773006-Prorocentrum_lima.AAC.1
METQEAATNYNSPMHEANQSPTPHISSLSHHEALAPSYHPPITCTPLVQVPRHSYHRYPIETPHDIEA